MAFGIDTFIFHLDMIQDSDSSWNDFKQWSLGILIEGNVEGGDPVFAGRNFLGGSFIWGRSEATNSSSELQGQLAATDPSPAHPENLKLRVPLIAPIQAPQPDRQKVTNERGRLYGAIDAQVLCRKLFWSIYSGEFAVNNAEGWVQVWLAVDPESSFSLDYWAGWADKVYNFAVSVPYGSLHPTRILQPFVPCILCHYQADATKKFKRDPGVSVVLNNVEAKYPRLHTHCHAFWADTVELDDAPTAPTPKIDWTRFDIDERPLIWRFAKDLKNADGSNINTMFGVDVAKDPKDPPASKLKGTDYMLVAQKWQPNASDIINIGFSITDEMTAARVRCVQSTPLPEMPDNRPPKNEQEGVAHFRVRGGQTQQVGRYIRIRAVDSMSRAEAERLSNAGIEIFTVWESGNVLAHAEPKVIGYFNPAFHAGTEDGNAAFAYCGDILRQPPQTPIFFCVDFDAPANDELDLPSHDAAKRARTLRTQQWILNYFNLVRTARDRYAQQNPDRFYLIGVYAGGEVLRWLYKMGAADCFWQAVSFAGTGSQPPRWPWYHANRWQYQFTETPNHPLPVRWDCVGGADPDADWGDGGSWILTDPLAQRLEAVERAEALQFWGNLLDAIIKGQ
jgi:hypothetical protein